MPNTTGSTGEINPSPVEWITVGGPNIYRQGLRSIPAADHVLDAAIGVLVELGASIAEARVYIDLWADDRTQAEPSEGYR